jgi:methylthioribose-1-phosphate isomerase
VAFLDQTLLPARTHSVQTGDYRVVADAIRSLKIRGAPAIGVAAAFAVVLAAQEFRSSPSQRKEIETAIAHLAATRPTAVNLFYALDCMRKVLGGVGGDPEGIVSALLTEAERIRREDVDACRRIGEHGAKLLAKGGAVLTHCNAGALATAGIGTALGVITTAWGQGNVTRVYVDETRPLLQGARLTAWELVTAGIPVTLIADTTAASVLAAGRVNAVIVGADRIAANGDVANKVGTYPLAVLARRHGVPFYVAAPFTTVDPATASGNDIIIEERSASEIVEISGKRMAPEGVDVYAPAFDITPNEFVTAIVLETGVVYPPFTGLTANRGEKP